ncbi:MAG: NAD(P)-dependent oxidoreductase [Candidatus Limnocylindrales bacterium]
MTLQRILVTGGGGRVGRAVVARLLDAGHPVTTLSLADAVPQQGVRVVRGDARDPAIVADALEDVEAVAHLAAIPTPRGRPAPEVFANNVTATFSVLWTAAERGVRRFVIASSVNAIGLLFHPHRPLPARYPLDETTPADIADPYSLSKATDEATLHAVCRAFGGSGVALRMPLMVAPADAAGLTTWAREHDADGARDGWGWLDVRDGAECFQLALDGAYEGVHVLQVAAPTTLQERSTAELLARYAPGVPVRGALTGHAAPIDTGRARSVLGFEPRHLVPGEVT